MKERTPVSGQAVCKRLLHELSRAYVEGITSLFHEQATITFPYAGPEPKVITGTKAYGQFLANAFRVMKDLTFHHVEVTPAGDTYWIQADATGTVLAGDEEKTYRQRYVMKLHLTDGRIDDYTEYSNPLPLLAILGEAGIRNNFN